MSSRFKSFNSLFNEIKKCKLAKTCLNRKVRQFYFANEETAPNYPVMFVCESPATAMGFGDGSVRERCWDYRAPDEHFRGMIKMVKLEGAYITNVIKCGARVKDRPTVQDIQNCLAFLHAEVELLTPRLIVCVGFKSLDYCTKYLEVSVPMHYVPHYSWTRKPTYDPVKEKQAYLAIKNYL